MKIQQHDGVVVDAGRHSNRASPRLRGRDVTGKGGGARGWSVIPPLPPTIYRGPRGGAGPRRCNLLGGAAAKGKGGVGGRLHMGGVVRRVAARVWEG